MCVCVLCMGVNEIISASKRWHLLLSLLEKFQCVSLPISLTCKSGIKVEKKKRRKKGRESVSDTVIKILCSTSMERMCMYIM